MSDTPETPRTPEEFERALGQVEREFTASRRFGRRALKQLHHQLTAEIRRIERRATDAERRAAAAEAKVRRLRRRAKDAEQQLVEVKQSATWKAGRVVVAVPARLRRKS